MTGKVLSFRSMVLNLLLRARAAAPAAAALLGVAQTSQQGQTSGIHAWSLAGTSTALLLPVLDAGSCLTAVGTKTSCAFMAAGSTGGTLEASGPAGSNRGPKAL